jgi:hypothetical protein
VITILTSGVGLGVYVPALLNQRALRAAGRAAEVEVLESLYTEPQLARHLAHRAAFRDNFQLALIANRMPVQSSLDEERLTRLLARWREQERSQFIVWSGFWLPVLDRYGAAATVDLCRIDAIPSASFRNQPRPKHARDIWLWNWQERRLEWQIPVSDEPPVPYEARADRLVVHGGGWAIGSFERVLPELARTRHGIDLLGPQDWSGRRSEDRHFAPNPAWSPWQRTASGELSFPALRGATGWLANDRFPSAHALVREARAIVSKPGGGTLIDSLAAATPVVLLEPYGEAEARSGALWEELGFGIRFERWREAGFDPELLVRLHHNLRAAKSQPPYPIGALA